jgi:hypothetical protein
MEPLPLLVKGAFAATPGPVWRAWRNALARLERLDAAEARKRAAITI